MSNLIFNDVPDSHWASKYIYFLESRGIISGYPEDGSFRPSNPVRIGEFCSMAVNAANISSVINNNTDSNTDHWARKYTNYVNVEREISLYAGTQITRDVIELFITREYAFSVAWRIVASIIYSYVSPYTMPFTDIGHNDFENHIANYNNLHWLCANGIVGGFDDYTIRPRNTLTRAEASTIISKSIASEQMINAFATAMARISINAESRSLYDIPLLVQNMPGNSSRQFEITYNPRILAIDNLCVTADKKILSVGDIPESNINITQFEPKMGFIAFEYTGNIANIGSAGIVNTIRFMSVGSGRTTVTAGVSTGSTGD